MGVASTFYHICNSTYDTGWLEYSAPLYLTGLSDGEYSIDYYSTDNIGNTEHTNTATVILDNTPPTTTLTIGEPKCIFNTFTDGWVIVAMIGDVTGSDGWPDGKVDMRDVAAVARSFGSYMGHSLYNPNYNIDSDGKIDMKDVGIAARNFGKIDP